MIYLRLTYLILIIFFCHFSAGYSQQTTISDPLKPEQVIRNFNIGFFGGINYPASPDELTKSPVNSTPSVQQSLLNGFDGLGYSVTYNTGMLARYPLSSNLNLGMNISYSGWKSNIRCNCIDTLIGISTNTLGFLHIAILPQYYFTNNFYIAPELSFNIFSVHATENDTKRGKVDFSESYPRIGAGIALGYEFILSRNLALDISAKAQLPNLLMKEDDDAKTPDSESIVNSGNESKEASILILSFNIGLLLAL